MSRTIQISLVLIFLVIIFGSRPEPPPSLRVMSYNIRAAVESDLSQIAQEIRSHSPDIVALQEVDAHWGERSSFADQAAALGEALGMHVFFGEIYDLPPDEGRNENRKYGLALLSRHPFHTRENHSLTRLSSLNESDRASLMPGFPEVGISLNGHTVHIFNTHLDYRPDPAIRKKQVDEMLKIVRRRKSPVILMGDLNAEPNDPELGKLFDLFNDIWKKSDGKGFTFPADEPQKRIDYILFSDHFKVAGAYVADSQKSDHRPVIGTLILE